jgi:hypothetical protein
VIAITRDELLDLLTTAALIGEDMPSLPGTRGDVAAVLERRMRRTLAGLTDTAADEAGDAIPDYMAAELATQAASARE